MDKDYSGKEFESKFVPLTIKKLRLCNDYLYKFCTCEKCGHYSLGNEDDFIIYFHQDPCIHDDAEILDAFYKMKCEKCGYQWKAPYPELDICKKITHNGRLLGRAHVKI